MKTPAFWSEPNFLSRLLKPLGTVYAFATRLRIGLGRPCKIGRPVVCIGNLTAGGTGKTPVAVADGSSPTSDAGRRCGCRTFATGRQKSVFCFPRLRRHFEKHHG